MNPTIFGVIEPGFLNQVPTVLLRPQSLPIGPKVAPFRDSFIEF